MKKSLARVKQQLADQLRPGKTDVLSEELQAADKRVEYLREVLTTLTKVLPLPSNGDKRPKKGPDYNIYNGLKNDKLLNNDESYGELIQPVFARYTDMFYNLTEEYTNYESEVDKNVALPIHKLLETDIIKLKKNLNKYVSDRDTANNRLQTAQNRHSELAYKHHTDPSKLSSLQEDVEEAGQKVEQASDQLAHDMFTLLAKEPEIANYILLHIKLRRQYYENTLDILNRLIPDIEHLINNSEVRPVFNCALSDHLRVTKRKIALPIELCVCAILEHGIAEEGLFRVAGGASKLRRLKLSIDANCLTLPLPVEYKDIHLFAGVLKSYLRELPEPLLTLTRHEDWIRAGQITNEEKRISAIKDILANLPCENYDNLKYLIKFLSELSKNPQNKMSSHNIAIVMSPNLLWKGQEPDLEEIGCTSRAVDTLVTHADLFFPGETNFYITYKSGEIFRPDITNKLFTHVRNSSNDTNAIILDHDGICSYNIENSSPKPIARRKNKPAPEPPKIAVELGDKSKVTNNITIRSMHNKNEIDNNVEEVRRKSLDIDVDSNYPTKTNLRKDHHLSKEDIGQPVLISNTNVKDLIDSVLESGDRVQTANVNKISAHTVTVGKIIPQSPDSVPTTKFNVHPLRPINRPPPIAAPRLSLAPSQNQQENKMTKSLNDMDNEIVELRKPKEEYTGTIERGNKPSIPERPASLRPASFRIPRTGNNNENLYDSTPAMEKIVMYNVPDKQQVSYVQFKDREKVPPGHDNQITEKEKFLGHQPTSLTYHHPIKLSGQEDETNSLCDQANKIVCDEIISTNSLQRRRSIGAKPVRPPKPDIRSTERINLLVQSNERLDNAAITNSSTEPNNIPETRPSHSRTMSEGNIVDSSNDSSSLRNSPPQTYCIQPPSPRSTYGPSRPPRPQPPPPPPPTAHKNRLSTESTDL